ncbi:MAG: hypothetical protein Q9162_006065 [Coniocarpon cinnabarinum]
MSSPISFASHEVAYPPYTAEFDPYDRGYLIVGGGGGESRTGVPNRITVLDTSLRSSIEDVGSIDLPTTDDCVTSIASLTTPTGLKTLACQASGRRDRQAGKDDHLLSVDFTYPSKTLSQQAHLVDAKKKGLKTQAEARKLGKTRVLSQKATTGKYANAEPVRLSPAKRRDVSTKRVGAVASKDADVSEIAIFDATKDVLDQSAVVDTLDLSGKDAEDIDIWSSSESEFSIAWCQSEALYLQNFKYAFSQGTYQAEDRKEVYKTASTHHRNLKQCRFLTEDYIVALSGLIANRTSELLIMHRDGTVTQRYPLPRFMRTCAAMDVVQLDRDPGTGAHQIIIACGGHDGSIHICFTEYNPSSPIPTSKPRKFSNLNDVHNNSVCKLAFSPFFPPRQPASSPMSIAASTQHVRLASLGIMSNRVVVESIALTSTPTTPFKATEEKGKPGTPTVRWVLSSTTSESMLTWLGLMAIGLAVLVAAITFQRYRSAGAGDILAPLRLMPMKEYNIPGATPSAAGRSSVFSKASEHLSASSAAAENEGVAQVAQAVNMAEQAIPSDTDIDDAKVQSLRELVDEHSSDSGPGSDGETSGAQKVILVSPHSTVEDQVRVMVHEAGHKALDGAKRFSELAEADRHTWLERLKATGRWAEEEGVTVLEGVVFSEFARDVGGAIRDAVLN